MVGEESFTLKNVLPLSELRATHIIRISDKTEQYKKLGKAVEEGLYLFERLPWEQNESPGKNQIREIACIARALANEKIEQPLTPQKIIGKSQYRLLLEERFCMTEPPWSLTIHQTIGRLFYEALEDSMLKGVYRRIKGRTITWIPIEMTEHGITYREGLPKQHEIEELLAKEAESFLRAIQTGGKR